MWDTFVNLDSDDTKTATNGRTSCMEYFSHYDDTWEVLAVEEPVIFNIGTYKYLVKLDLVVRLNGNIFVVEHKTTKNIGGNYFSRYMLNTQMSAQTYACKEKYSSCSGVLLNVLSVKNVKKPVLIDPSNAEVKAYSQVEIKHSKYYGKPMAYCSGITFDFRREVVNRTPQQLDDFITNVLHWIPRIEGEAFYPKNEHFCTSFKGCEFKELCFSCDDAQIKEQLYMKGEDPYAYMFR